MPKYLVGVIEFDSKAHLKRVLAGAKFEQPHLTRVSDPSIAETLSSLIELDDEAGDKIGAGIDHWVVFDNSVDTLYRSTGFRPMRVDGSGPVRFSYMDVIDKPTRKQLVQEALTLEAIQITLEWRQAQFDDGPAKCARSGDLIEHYKDAQAIHLSPPRRVLHAHFLSGEGLNFDTVEIVKHPTDSGFRLRDRSLAERWCTYQREHLTGMAIAKIRRLAT